MCAYGVRLLWEGVTSAKCARAVSRIRRRDRSLVSRLLVDGLELCHICSVELEVEDREVLVRVRVRVRVRVKVRVRVRVRVRSRRSRGPRRSAPRCAPGIHS